MFSIFAHEFAIPFPQIFACVVLFLSDIHLGRSDGEDRRRQEAELIAFLRAMRKRCKDEREGRLEHLYLMGDVFEEYIEYRHLIPKGFARFQGLLAEWVDAGIPITYLVGNHDPWHIDFYEREIGVTIEYENVVREHQGQRLYLAHGDRVISSPSVRTWLKGWLRHPLPVWIYRHLLPGDLGISIARFVNSTFGKRDINQKLVNGLRARAREILSDFEVDAVVFGHSHSPEVRSWPEGNYMNAGYWHESRTFGRLIGGTLQLMRWNGEAADIVER